MKTCVEWQEDLVALQFGEIDDTAEARLNHHLSACEACRLESRRLLELRVAARDAGPAPSARLRARIAAALPRRASRPTGWMLRPIPAYVAVVAALMGALAVVAFSAGRPRSVPAVERSAPGVEVHDGQLPFIVADSHDTRVVSSRTAIADSTPARARSGTDSL